MPLDIVFWLLIIISVFTDLVYRKIYNWLTVSGMILGLGFNTVIYGLTGLTQSVLGFAVGFLFLFFFFLLGGIGAGDVKLMAAIGAIKGWEFVLYGGLYGVFLGGIVAIIVMIIKGTFIKTMTKILHFFLSLILFRFKSIPMSKENTIMLPYGALISIGIAVYWIKITLC